jgi:hypothetical protein
MQLEEVTPLKMLRVRPPVETSSASRIAFIYTYSSIRTLLWDFSVRLKLESGGSIAT